MNTLSVPSLIIIILLITLSCLSHQQDNTALAFTTQQLRQHSITHHYSKNQQVSTIMTSLRVRGGSTKLSTTANQDDNEKSQKIMAQQALQSINYCVKMCFFSVSSSILITIIDSNIWSKFFSSTSTLGFVDYVNLFDSLSLFFFGGGLWRISSIYFQSMSDSTKRMDHDKLMQLFNSMIWIWSIIALNMGLVSISMGALLPGQCSTGHFHFLLKNVSSKHVSLGIACILAIGSFIMYKICETNAAKEVKAYRETNKIVSTSQVQRRLYDRKSTREKFDMVRESGFWAYYSQAICAGSFGVVATLELLKWIVAFKIDGIVGHIFGVTEFITPFTITVLLFTLNKALLCAAVAEVIGDSLRKGDTDKEIYSNLFNAQTGFYNEAANTMKTA